MRKFFYYFIPIVILGFFVLVMLSESYLKKPLGIEDDFVKYLDKVINNVDQEQWGIAAENLEKLENAWQKVAVRIQFSAERDEMNQMIISLARTKGAIRAKDKAEALIELGESRTLWDHVGK